MSRHYDRIGSDIKYWILTEAGHVIARTNVQHITMTDMATDAIKNRVLAFDEHLLTQLSDDNYQIDMPNHAFCLQDGDGDQDNDNSNIPPDVEYGDMIQMPKLGADEVEYKTFEQYIGAKFLVNSNGDSVPPKVVKHARDYESQSVQNTPALCLTHVNTNAS